MYDLLWKRANEHGQFLKYSAQIMEKKNNLAMREKKQDSIFQYFITMHTKLEWKYKPHDPHSRQLNSPTLYN